MESVQAGCVRLPFAALLIPYDHELCRRVQFTAARRVAETLLIGYRDECSAGTDEVPPGAGRFRGSDFAGGERIAGTARPAVAGPDSATIRQSHSPLRAALSLQRMRQQLQILRLLARQSDSARDALRGRSAARGARAQGAGLPQYPPRRRG